MQTQLFIPDRFDTLQRRAPLKLDSIVMPVDASLAEIKNIQRSMAASGRGALLLLRGESGSGKSTFVNTLGLFLESISVIAIKLSESIETRLRSLSPDSAALRVCVIEGREALKDIQPSVLEASIHEINSFVRSEAGERTLVVWLVNADDMLQTLLTAARKVGDDALLGSEKQYLPFSGPAKTQFVDIANRTIATLNQGASLHDLGVSNDRAIELALGNATIGRFLGALREDLLRNEKVVERLLDKERCRLWIVTCASNEPEGDVDGLTRGAAYSVDIDRLFGATNANIVQDLKKYPDKLGILGAVLDAKILFLPMVAALAIARSHGDSKLHALMAGKGMSTTKASDAIERLQDSNLGRAFSGGSSGTRARGPKPGPNTEDAFKKLTEIASDNDGLINIAVGSALQAAGLISTYKPETDLGSGLQRYSDLSCESATYGKIRLEFMWRAETGRAAIANYTLQKLYNYGRAIGFLE